MFEKIQLAPLLKGKKELVHILGKEKRTVTKHNSIWQIASCLELDRYDVHHWGHPRCSASCLDMVYINSNKIRPRLESPCMSSEVFRVILRSVSTGVCYRWCERWLQLLRKWRSGGSDPCRSGLPMTSTLVSEETLSDSGIWKRSHKTEWTTTSHTIWAHHYSCQLLTSASTATLPPGCLLSRWPTDSSFTIAITWPTCSPFRYI